MAQRVVRRRTTRGDQGRRPPPVSRRVPIEESPAFRGSWSTSGAGRSLIARAAGPAIGPRGFDPDSLVVSWGMFGGQDARRRATRPFRSQNSSTFEAPVIFQARRTSSTRTSSGSLADAASPAKLSTIGSPSTARATRSAVDRSQEAARPTQGPAEPFERRVEEGRVRGGRSGGGRCRSMGLEVGHGAILGLGRGSGRGKGREPRLRSAEALLLRA